MKDNTTIKVITDSEELESLKKIWNSLLQECGVYSSVYLTHEWVSTWWKHFGAGSKLNILLIEKEHKVIGLVPLMRNRYRVGLINIDTLVTIGATNCNYIGLIIPQYGEEAINALSAYLENELAKGFVIFSPTMIPQNSKFLELLRKKDTLSSRNLVMREKVLTLAPYIPLPTTWDEYYGSLSQKRRQILRRALQTLEEAHNVGFHQYDLDSVEDGLRKFFDLHQRRWQSDNISGLFSDSRMKEFYKDISFQFLEKGWLHFSYLTVDNEVVSSVYGFIHNRKFYGATSARDMQYSRYSIGHLHYMFLIKDAIRRRLREFDFLQGDEPYKFYWTELVRKYTRVRITRKSFWLTFLLKFTPVFWLFYGIRHNGLKDTYYRYIRKIREDKEKKKMGLNKR